MNLTDYWDELNKHDWYFNFSDDSRVWRKGKSEWNRLQAISLQSPAHKEMLEGFKKHYFSGPPWDTQRAPKPTRPTPVSATDAQT